jgi:hypothetical protein
VAVSEVLPNGMSDRGFSPGYVGARGGRALVRDRIEPLLYRRTMEPRDPYHSGEASGGGDRGVVVVFSAGQLPRRTMTDSDLVLIEGDGNSGRVSLTPEDRRRRLTAISARVGVWGIIGGLSSIAIGFMSPGVALGAAGLGFLAGGIGAIGTSILVAKDLKRAPVPLKLAAFVGVPFGASLIAFACGTFLGWPFSQRLFAYAIPTGAILGVVLMILLLTGFLSHAFSGRGSEGED